MGCWAWLKTQPSGLAFSVKTPRATPLVFWLQKPVPPAGFSARPSTPWLKPITILNVFFWIKILEFPPQFHCNLFLYNSGSIIYFSWFEVLFLGTIMICLQTITQGNIDLMKYWLFSLTEQGGRKVQKKFQWHFLEWHLMNFDWIIVNIILWCLLGHPYLRLSISIAMFTSGIFYQHRWAIDIRTWKSN